jgi:uncharacterized protein YndB with AHSA1/START domain
VTGHEYPCEPVELAWLAAAPVRMVARRHVAADPQAAFDSFFAKDLWPRWASAVESVQWDPGFPPSVGSTRRVVMRDGMVGHEEFIAWDPPRRLAFRMGSTSTPLARAFAESFEVFELSAGRCRVEWTMALDPVGMRRRVAPLARPFILAYMRLALRGVARQLAAGAVPN